MSAVEGARCAHHPSADAPDVCARCGDFLCAECVATRSHEGAYCDGCAEHAGPVFPWERRAELGIGRALVRTLWATLRHPYRSFFEGPLRERSTWPAMMFGVALTTASTAALALAHWAFRGAALGTDELLWYAARPIMFMPLVWVFAAGWWLGLRMSGRVDRSVPYLARVIAYVIGATTPLNALVWLANSWLVGWFPLPWLLVRYGLIGVAIAAACRASAPRTVAASVVAFVVFTIAACGTIAPYHLVTSP